MLPACLQTAANGALVCFRGLRKSINVEWEISSHPREECSCHQAGGVRLRELAARSSRAQTQGKAGKAPCRSRRRRTVL